MTEEEFEDLVEGDIIDECLPQGKLSYSVVGISEGRGDASCIDVIPIGWTLDEDIFPSNIRTFNRRYCLHLEKAAVKKRESVNF